MKLSIIIPVYNAEKYLTKCLNSIVTQNLDKSFEVILINDGSTDRSLEIAESFRSKILNYQIYSQTNQGEAVSRNVALKKSVGEYITFLDSDDYYEINTLGKALNIIERDNLDIMYLRLKQVDEEGNFLGFVYDLPSEGSVLKGLKYERRPYPATMYKKNIVGDLTFPLGILVGPDSVFNAMVQSKAQKVAFTHSAIYNYTFRKDSLSKQGKSEKAFRGFLKAIEELRSFQNLHFNDDPDAKLYFDKLYEVFVTRILELNIMPEWNRARYDTLLSSLTEWDLQYVLNLFIAKYPHVDTSYFCFKGFQKYLALKTRIYKLIYRA